MSVEGEQTSQFQNESSWSNMPLFHLFETQFHSTYIFLKLSPVGPSSKAKKFFFIQALLIPTSINFDFGASILSFFLLQSWILL